MIPTNEYDERLTSSASSRADSDCGWWERATYKRQKTTEPRKFRASSRAGCDCGQRERVKGERQKESSQRFSIYLLLKK